MRRQSCVKFRGALPRDRSIRFQRIHSPPLHSQAFVPRGNNAIMAIVEKRLASHLTNQPDNVIWPWTVLMFLFIGAAVHLSFLLIVQPSIK